VIIYPYINENSNTNIVWLKESYENHYGTLLSVNNIKEIPYNLKLIKIKFAKQILEEDSLHHGMRQIRIMEAVNSESLKK